MLDWMIINARLTVFVTPDTVVPSGLWQAILGEEPETSFAQRSSATRIETGPYADGKLTLQVQPIRVDWIHESIGFGDGGQPSVLGIFPGSSESLLQVGRRWVHSDGSPSIQRMALGFVLISPTPNRESGYEELRQFIDGVPTAPDATDFSYQVNRPRPSRAHLDGLQVNRLSKWSVGSYKVFTLGPLSHSIESPLVTHLRLELDVSTNPDFQGIIPREAAVGVMDDLFNGAKEICEQGNHF
jgi:hypothetical protein